MEVEPCTAAEALLVELQVRCVDDEATPEAHTELALQRRVVESERRLRCEVLSPLPSNAVESIFLCLPMDMRMRCREVCRPWFAFLEERRLWYKLDLSGAQRASASLLMAAAAPCSIGQSAALHKS